MARKKTKDITTLNNTLIDSIYEIWKSKALSDAEKHEMLSDAITEIQMLLEH